MAKTLKVAEEPRAVVRKLLDSGGRTDFPLWNRIRALGHAAVPALVELLEDPALADERRPDAGLVPFNAARLLGELGSVDAIEPMLRVLDRADPQDLLHAEIVFMLPSLGAAIVEPVLRAHARASSGAVRSSLATILADAEVRDDRIFELLLAELGTDVTRAAGLLSGYGDFHALPALSRVLDATPMADDMLEQVFELVDAIRELGGSLSPAQAAKAAWSDEADRRGREEPEGPLTHERYEPWSQAPPRSN